MILRLVPGVLLSAMAAGQAASFGAMGDILGAYEVTGGAASVTVAVVLYAWLLRRTSRRAPLLPTRYSTA
ncbi:hypothetical protein [Streptomyces halobius]|uniref:Uncharacterized protein n=1 Tax=Streptomyces halobius TaxID=2879846 RepID=A0ABY4MJ09_9ACTN|nr:hypothetical protein [Streptomyces halobius]UQA97063.1 hypothetical protein K9S39_38970 [Streptomyces halobius]